MVEFVHLHLHTEYSLLDGMCRVAEATKLAREMGMKSLAITDHGKMFGVVPFYQSAVDHGVKPIIGCEFYLAPGSRRDRKTEKSAESYSHLTLLARNETGYRNLMRLSTIAHTEGFYHRPRIDREVLEAHRDGLVLLSGCLKGEISSFLLREDLESARKTAGFYRELFGPDFYLEIQDNGLPEQKAVIPRLAGLSRETGVPLVATNDCHYLRREDSVAHDTLLCVQTASKLNDPRRLRFSSDQFYFRSPAEMAVTFSEFPEALRNTLAIADKCHLVLEFGRTLLPHYQTPDGSALPEHLEKLAERGLRERYGIDRNRPGKGAGAVIERMERELTVIRNMGYSGYFLILGDIVNYARQQGISVGPGRGSAAGSVVAYLVKITDIDPLKYGLLFERFLNPDRVSMPDIDIDFEDTRREEVIAYIRSRYGERQIAQIVTFGTLSARTAIRDVGRVLDLGYAEVDRLAKKVPEELHITIAEALRRERELADAVAGDERIRKLFEISRALEGMPRHASTHAAGIVIGPGPLDEYTPLFLGTNNAVTTQYEMNALGELGLLKIDLLGLKTLTVIKNAAAAAAQRLGREVDPARFPLDDEKTYRMLSEGATHGVFQLESAGMRDLLRKIAPDRFEDLIAILALYRPGPLGSGMVESYIQGRKNPDKITCDHPMLDDILRPTCGIILYQEQVMEIVHRMGNFTLAQSDLFRRAMGKKIPEIMEENRTLFLKGARDNKVPVKTAEKIFNQIVQFAGYGFNKSHSAGYALLCYQTACLKTNHPLEFMSALLTSETRNSDKIVEYINECDRMNIWVLPPCVEESRAEFTVFGNDIRFGLAAVKNVGFAAIRSIVRTKEKDGPFKSLLDLCCRVDLRLVNRRVLESLIKAGAMDAFRMPRSRLTALVPLVLGHAARYLADKADGQGNIFGPGEQEPVMAVPPEIAALPEWPEAEMLANEKEVLGFYISGHPLGDYEKILKKFATHAVRELAGLASGTPVRLGGIIEKVKKLSTRKEGRAMASFTLEDLSGKVEAMVFPDTFEKLSGLVAEGEIVFLEGKIDAREQSIQVLGSDIVPVYNGLGRYARKMVVSLYPVGLNGEKLQEVKEIVRQFPGSVPLFIRLVFPQKRVVTIRTDRAFQVNPEKKIFQELERALGRGAVTVS